MGKLYNMIVTVLERPELYIGRCSVQRLYAFINGYLYENDEANDHCLDGFNEFVAQKYNIASDHNWASIIEFFSCDGKEEMKLFKKLFEEFVREQNCQETREFITKSGFLELLKKHNIDINLVVFDDSIKDGYCVRKNFFRWEVFFRERGKEYDCIGFSSESSALQYLFDKLLSIYGNK